MKARVPAAILLIAALFLAACGGDSDEEKAQKAFADAIENAQKDLDKAAGNGNDDDTSNDADDKNTSSNDKSDSKSDDKSDNNDDRSSSSIPNFDNLGECMEISFGYAALGLASLGTMMGGDELSKSDLAELKSTVDELTKKLPKDIQGDFAVVAEAYNIAANEGFMSKKAQAALESNEFNKANDKVAAYIEDLCA